MGCLHQVDIKRALLHDIQRVLFPPVREGGAVLLFDLETIWVI